MVQIILEIDLLPITSKIMSPLPVVMSLQTTDTLLPEVNMLGSNEAPEFVLRFFVPSNHIIASA